MILEGTFGPLPDRAREALTRLVADLLNLSWIEAGRLVYEFRPVRLEEVVETVVKELGEAARRKRVTLNFRTRNEAGHVVTGDPEKLHEVVMNLVDNAIAYSPDGMAVDVEVRPAMRDGHRVLRLSITDHGIGITPEDLPRLFTKFGRTEAAREVRPDGMGLGLYLVKKLVEDHRGRVWAESPGAGRGSTFLVELPGRGGGMNPLGLIQRPIRLVKRRRPSGPTTIIRAIP